MPSRSSNSRTGVLKTVGTSEAAAKDLVIGDVHYRTEDPPQVKADLPEIDFGPTQLYDPTKPSSDPQRPSTRDRLDPRHRGAAGPLLGRASPGNVIESYNRASNLATPEPGVQSRSGSSGSEDPSANRRSMAWQPGAATIGPGSTQQSQQAITPEQFVQQRAAANRVVPAYAHARQQSGTPPLITGQPGTPPSRGHGRADSRTPPLVSRQSSGDWSAQLAGGGGRPGSRGDMRPGSRNDMRPGSGGGMRPSSRGAAAAMNASPASTPDYSAHLSAREQEHVARMTGSPLLHVGAPGSSSNINRAGHAPSGSGGGGGLVGAIEAREQEKKAMKEGWGGQMVQQAIAQRQRDQQQQQAAQYQQYQQQQQAQQAGRRMQQQMQPPGDYSQQFAHYPQQQQAQHQQMYGAQVTPPMQVPGGFPNTPPMEFQQQQQGYWGGGVQQQGQQGQSSQGQGQGHGHPVYGAGPYAQQGGGHGSYGGHGGGRGRQ